MIKYSGLIVVLLFGLGLGFWLGQKHAMLNPAVPAATERKPLYYRHPMNPKVASPTPAKDNMGMDYLPVYAEDPRPSGAQPQAGKILYYRHPMGAPDTSPVPKKDEMGMDYLPVYENEPETSGQIRISPEKIQKLGVTTETVSKRTLVHSIRALGSIHIDERRIHAVTPRFEGWIQRLYVNSTGQAVKRGQPLLEIYSPELVTAQQEFLIARQGQQALQQSSSQAQDTAAHLAENALQRLHYWDIGPAQLQRLKTLEKPLDTLPLLSPVNGVVLDKPAVEGMRFMPGELLFRIADLSVVWLLADVFEQDIGGVRPGQAVRVHINAYPERLFRGKVGFIYPTLATETRTVKVRVELANGEGLLKPGLYGSATLATLKENDARLAVPDSAVIDSGARQIVLLQR
ncbi:MAG: efflux RND transporter periplasmic adaptor subunit, partial [Gammaproteobacteria bacterium]